MLCFTDAVPDATTKGYIGNSCIACITLHIAGNLCAMSAESFKQIRRSWIIK